MAAEHTPDVAPQVGAELQTWRVRVLNTLFLVVLVAATPRITKSVVEALNAPEWWPQTLPFLAAYLFLLVFTVFRRLDFRVRVWGLMLVGYGFAALSFALFGLIGNGPLFLLALPVLATLLIEARAGLALAVLSLATYGAFAVLADRGWLAGWRIVNENPATLGDWLNTGLMFAGVLLMLVVMQALFSRAQSQALERERRSADELVVAHRQLQARTEELDRHTRLLEVEARVSRETAALLDRDELLERTVDLIAHQLDLDRIAVYLVGGPDQEVVLAAARSRPAHEPTLPGAVSQVIRSGAPQSVQFDAAGLVHHELTLPLAVGRQIGGALDVHATRPAPFGQQEIDALRGMADHLALALENARLFAETQASLHELDALYRHYTAEAWQRFEREHTGLTHRWQGAGEPSGAAWSALSAQARAGGTPVTGLDEAARLHLLAAPVKLRDMPIGVIGFQRPAEAGPWSQEQIAAIEAVADRLALAAENLRLLEQTQRRATRERLVAGVSARMRETLDVESVLKTTADEMYQALGLDEVVIRLVSDETDGRPGQ